ncbi:MAG: low molecular weight phosphotyrosine protein phosphatase [Bacteroidetes bacterium]|nr:low molecular weight phosphotyrosine protein phosphatase [Bacteroidota bacterium]
MAEGVFLDLIKKKNLSHLFDVDSAGTGNYHVGELPDSRMRETAKNHGITLTATARQLRRSDANNFDYIVAMDHSNRKNILSVFPEEFRAKIYLMRDFDNSGDEEVPDPYWGGMEEFEEVFQILLTANHNFLNKLIENNFAL